MSADDLLISLKTGVKTIKFNRPNTKNAFNPYIYKTISKTLNEDASNDEIVVTILTGIGSYFSSGNDIKAAMQQGSSKEMLTTVKNMVDSFIKYPKLLIAVVNGPAIGIGATIVALCDIIYVSDKAYFSTPFIRLGLCAEGCSSYTFPTILGRSKASEMILLGKNLSAEEAYNLGFAAQIIPQKNIEKFIENLHKYGKLSVNSVKINKKLIMQNFDKVLDECNERETKQLHVCTDSEEFSNAIMEFMTRKSKL